MDRHGKYIRRRRAQAAIELIVSFVGILLLAVGFSVIFRYGVTWLTGRHQWFQDSRPTALGTGSYPSVDVPENSNITIVNQ